MADITAEIKVAIKAIHNEVNHMNTTRIRHCLSGENKSATFFAIGITYYAEIYFGFEEAWEELDSAAENHDPNTIAYYEKISKISNLLRLDGLRRTERLQADIAHFRSLHPIVADITAEGPNTNVREEAKRRILEKPHRLLAYAWMLYQAVFNGGRIIRRQLIRQGLEFWGLTPADGDINLCPSPLSFWYCGEDPEFQRDFRTVADQAGALLDAGEREEVLRESVRTLEMCKGLTEELDRVTAGLV